jgi:hypothetical protein
MKNMKVFTDEISICQKIHFLWFLRRLYHLLETVFENGSKLYPILGFTYFFCIALRRNEAKKDWACMLNAF